jgi:hypothetical protein
LVVTSVKESVMAIDDSANDREILDVAALASAVIGETREWMPSYPDAAPIHCTAVNTGISVSFGAFGRRVQRGAAWTRYYSNRREETVWFPAAEWEKMPLVRHTAAG